MGTVVSLTIPLKGDAHTTADELEAATAVVERVFTELDAIFSLYRPASEASAMARGELTLEEASEVMRDCYADAAHWRILTGGAFTPERPDGVVDLSGIVKARAIREAGTSLLALGLRDWCLNAGGDVLVNGSPVPGSGKPWLAGVVDPADRRTLLTAFPLGGSPRVMNALATSGTSERGQHIWSAGLSPSGLAMRQFRQVSVAARDIIAADVLATAIMAGGQRTLDLAVEEWDVAALVVKNDGGLLATPGFRLAAG